MPTLGVKRLKSLARAPETAEVGLAFADQLRAALLAYDFAVTIDRFHAGGLNLTDSWRNDGAVRVRPGLMGGRTGPSKPRPRE